MYNIAVQKFNSISLMKKLSINCFNRERGNCDNEEKLCLTWREGLFFSPESKPGSSLLSSTHGDPPYPKMWSTMMGGKENVGFRASRIWYQYF